MYTFEISICIPTFNRANFLLKNIESLTRIIREFKLFDTIEIIVSNNNSTDMTEVSMLRFCDNNKDIEICYFFQETNIGLIKNAFFVLEKSRGKYVLFLGDDDYISSEYLIGALEHIRYNAETFCIIPNFIPVNDAGIAISSGRDDNYISRIYKKGFVNCLKNSWRGHQLSGLIVRNEDLVKTYIQKNISNLYLFIYFVSYSCLKGDTYHFIDYPIKVTQVSQDKKDWNYGSDGLINEVFDNYINLPISTLKITLLELYFFYKQPFRLFWYKKKGLVAFVNAFLKIITSKNSTLGFKIIFPILIFVSGIQIFWRFLKVKF